jgi:hypothetical protein
LGVACPVTTRVDVRTSDEVQAGKGSLKVTLQIAEGCSAGGIAYRDEHQLPQWPEQERIAADSSHPSANLVADDRRTQLPAN